MTHTTVEAVLVGLAIVAYAVLAFAIDVKRWRRIRRLETDRGMPAPVGARAAWVRARVGLWLVTPWFARRYNRARAAAGAAAPEDRALTMGAFSAYDRLLSDLRTGLPVHILNEEDRPERCPACAHPIALPGDEP